MISFFFKYFFKKKNNNTQDKMSKKEALEILGLQEGASREQIIKSHQKLVKKNHPDLGGSDWVTKN